MQTRMQEQFRTQRQEKILKKKKNKNKIKTGAGRVDSTRLDLFLASRMWSLGAGVTWYRAATRRLGN